MSSRRPDPQQASLEQALRRALRLAAESVEPSAGGLDQIRARIAARPSHTGASWWLRFWRPAGGGLRYAFGAAVERFRPEPGRAGWLGWLRPAAALATCAFVMAAASWALAALPQAIAPSNNIRSYHPLASPHHHRPRSAYPGSNLYGSAGPGGSPSASATCTPPSGTIAASPSNSQPASPSTSASPSASPSIQPPGSPSPSETPVASPQPTGSAQSAASAAARQRRASGTAASGHPSPAPSGLRTAPQPSPSDSSPASPGPSPSASGPGAPGPCGIPVP